MNHSPYRGPKAFLETTADYFAGRQIDIRKVIANLYSSPITLLYGATGVGKTSLLQAGVIPALRSEEERTRTSVIYFRDWSLTGIRGFEAICATEYGRVRWEPPPAGTDLPALLKKITLEGELEDPRGCFVILDQFEELLLLPEHQVGDFEDKLMIAVNECTRCTFMISIREDWLFKMDRYDRRIPNLFASLYHLHHLDDAQTEDAIRTPARLFARNGGNGGVEDRLVVQVIKDIREMCGGKVESLALQLVMEKVWEHQQDCGQNGLTFATYLDLGRADQIISNHIEEALADADEPIQRTLAQLVSPSGARKAYSLPDLAAIAFERPSSVPQPEEEQYVRTHMSGLVSKGMVMELSGNYELIHDLMGPPVRVWINKRIIAHESRNLAADVDLYRNKAEQLEVELQDQSERQRKLIETTLKDLRRSEGLRLILEGRVARPDEELRILLSVHAYNVARLNDTLDARLSRLFAITLAEHIAARPHSVLVEEPQGRISSRGDALRGGFELPEWQEATSGLEGGQLLALEVGSEVRVWAKNPTVPISNLAGHKPPATAVAFSPNGDLLSTIDGTSRVRLWDVNSQKLVHEFDGSYSSAALFAVADEKLFQMGLSLLTRDLAPEEQARYFPFGGYSPLFRGELQPVQRSTALSSDDVIRLSIVEGNNHVEAGL